MATLAFNELRRYQLKIPKQNFLKKQKGYYPALISCKKLEAYHASIPHKNSCQVHFGTFLP